jgi:hypothetical protein
LRTTPKHHEDADAKFRRTPSTFRTTPKHHDADTK